MIFFWIITQKICPDR